MNTLKPDFSHRLSALSDYKGEFDLGDLVDTILLSTGQATALINLMSLQFASDNEPLCSNAINHASLMAIENIVDDIGAVLRAYHAKVSGNKKAANNQ